MSTSTALITLDALKAEDVFAAGGPEKVVAQVRVKVAEANDLDATTDEGRSAIKSLAFKIARTKTGLDDLGKEYVADMKKRAGVVDAGRRLIRDELDTLRDQVRKPVDEWEAAEDARIGRIAAALTALEALEKFEGEASIDEIDSRIATLDGYRGQDFQEMADRATQLIGRVGPALMAKRQATLQREEERAELERLRKAEADRQAREEAERLLREQRDRDERIAQEAADRARKAAEDAAAAAQRKAEEDRAAAEARAQRAEHEAREALARAERDRQQAEEAQRLAVQRQEEARQQAIEDERKRRAAEEAQARHEADERARDQEHRREVNRTAAAALVQNVTGMSEDMARAVVLAIIRGTIPRITLTY